MIEAKHLSGGYEDFAVHNVNLSVREGEFLAILGPNGSGKSTLFKLLTGLLPPRQGEILLKGRPLKSYSSKEKARLVSVLGQEEQVAFPFTVEEVVALGRYPHQNRWFASLSLRDKEVIDEALEITQVKEMRHKPFHLLSGGEKQRVLLAKALAQEAQCLFLDEPTNHLDLKHSFDLLGMLKDWQQSKRLTVVAILHDLNLAALYADRVALMKDGALTILDDIKQLNDGDDLEKLYDIKVAVLPHPHRDRPQFMLASREDGAQPAHTLFRSYHTLEEEGLFCLSFDHPLKAITNDERGRGIGWFTHFCHIYAPHLNRGDTMNGKPLLFLEKHGLSLHQTALFISSSKVCRYMLLEEDGELPALVGVTVGEGKGGEPHLSIMLFLDGFLTDGALVEGLMYVIGVRERAMAQVGLGRTAWPSLAESVHGLVAVAASQRGRKEYHHLPLEKLEPLLSQALDRLVKLHLTHQG